jgi:hypothetical protein
MQRNVIQVFIDHDLRQQSGPGQRPLKRLRRLRGQHDVARAALAGVFDTLVLDDEHLGRLVIELAGRLDADLVTRLAALRAEALEQRQFVTPRFATQRGRRPAPAMRLALATAFRGIRRGRRRRCRLGRGQFREQQRLVRIDRLHASATLQQGIEPLLHLGQLAPITP